MKARCCSVEDDFQIFKYQRDKNPHPHFHEFYEILIPLSSEGTFFVRKNGYPLSFGMVFLLQEFEIHRCFCRANQDCNRYVVHFPKSILQKMSTRKTDLVSLFTEAPLVLRMRDDELADMLGMLFKLTKPSGSGFGADIERGITFQSFLLMLGKIIEKQEPCRAPAIQPDPRVNAVLQYIHDNYSNTISLEDLSAKFYLSKSRLSQQFREATGFSIGDYIITYRVKRACALLQEGMRIQDISKATGFKSDTHFIRTFKKRVGVCPSEFVKRSGETAQENAPGGSGGTAPQQNR